MKVSCIRTGVVRGRRDERGIRRYLWGGWAETTLPVNAFAIEHPEGVCLFDAGQTARAADPGYLPRWHPFLRLARFELRPEEEVASQLQAEGISAGDVRWVVLSHLHTDHVGGLGPFAGSEVLVAREEWERATGLGGRLRGYLPQHWPAGLQPRLLAFEGPAVGPFPASADLAGDERLVVMPTPGHTPGHVSLLIRDGERSYLCAGDLAKTAAELDQVSPELARFCRREGIVVLTSHDRGAAEALAASESREGAP
jgi:glyoxylase-like metal-dependent hydrolase (beta-lactamase superfamily II)